MHPKGTHLYYTSLERLLSLEYESRCFTHRNWCSFWLSSFYYLPLPPKMIKIKKKIKKKNYVTSLYLILLIIILLLLGEAIILYILSWVKHLLPWKKIKNIHFLEDFMWNILSISRLLLILYTFIFSIAYNCVPLFLFASWEKFRSILK